MRIEVLVIEGLNQYALSCVLDEQGRELVKVRLRTGANNLTLPNLAFSPKSTHPAGIRLEAQGLLLNYLGTYLAGLGQLVG